jgi:hypothetical protein
LRPSTPTTLSLLAGRAAKAFDITDEKADVVRKYDTTMFKWGKPPKYALEPSILGKQLLMARRLVEAGVGFVTVHGAGWCDMHDDANNYGIIQGMPMYGPPLDKALSAFLRACAELVTRFHPGSGARAARPLWSPALDRDCEPLIAPQRRHTSP